MFVRPDTRRADAPGSGELGFCGLSFGESDACEGLILHRFSISLPVAGLRSRTSWKAVTLEPEARGGGSVIELLLYGADVGVDGSD